MHHPATPKPPESKTCSCRSTTDTSALAIASLLGPIAVLPSVSTAVDFPAAADSVAVAADATIDGPQLPDADPPVRAFIRHLEDPSRGSRRKSIRTLIADGAEVFARLARALAATRRLAFPTPGSRLGS